jgi:hypothetical protein
MNETSEKTSLTDWFWSSGVKCLIRALSAHGLSGGVASCVGYEPAQAIDTRAEPEPSVREAATTGLGRERLHEELGVRFVATRGFRHSALPGLGFRNTTFGCG